MRTFFFVLTIGIVSVYNIGGIAGVIAWLTGLGAGAIAIGMFWYATQADTDNDGTGDACDNDGLTDGDEVNTHNTDPTNPDTDGDSNDQPLLLALFILLDPCTTEKGAIEYSLCSTPYGRCTTTPADPDAVEVAQPKFLPMRRNRMAHMGEAERRASRGKADNSWKNHRKSQWR